MSVSPEIGNVGVGTSGAIQQLALSLSLNFTSDASKSTAGFDLAIVPGIGMAVARPASPHPVSINQAVNRSALY